MRLVEYVPLVLRLEGFIDTIESSVYNKLVQVPRFRSISVQNVLKYGNIIARDNHKAVGHVESSDSRFACQHDL